MSAPPRVARAPHALILLSMRRALPYLTILSTLTQKPLFLVGGAVRDLLLGRPQLSDIDIALSSGASAVAEAFARAIDGSFFFLDRERDVSRVIKNDCAGTIQFDFSNFEGGSLEADLRRRDFTINAMAIELRRYLATQSLDGIHDVSRGRDDLRSRTIRVSCPEALDDDPLRMLRAVRFSATLGFAIDPDTAAAIEKRSPRVLESAPERIRDELFCLFAERNADRHLRLLDRLGLHVRLFPELEPLRGFAPGRYHVHDVLMHSHRVVGCIDAAIDALGGIAPEHRDQIMIHLDGRIESGVSRMAALRFACLLHDCAKPETYSHDGGRIRFHGHDKLGAEKAAAICRRMRLSRDAEKMVCILIRQHMRLFNLATPNGPSTNALYRYCRDIGSAVPESLLLAQADGYATSEIMPDEQFTDTTRPMAAVLDYYFGRFLKTEALPLVTGDDLVRLGLQPGPIFRIILEEIKERRAEGGLLDRAQALAFLAERLGQ